MKRTILVTLLLLVSSFAVSMKTTGNSQPGKGETDAADRWEYLAVASPSTTNFTPTGNPNMRKLEEGGFGREAFVLEQHLDKLGAKGWELVSVAGMPSDPVFYFRRRR
ncbi:MAG: hypothetical protein QOD75_274 [Blastocatellia bacterium]|jgi:hypothetical protein|nr:hypothetical protein [Blastocatellia bacterium]